MLVRFQSCHGIYVVKCNDIVLIISVWYNLILYVVLYSFHFSCVVVVSNIGRLRTTVHYDLGSDIPPPTFLASRQKSRSPLSKTAVAQCSLIMSWLFALYISDGIVIRCSRSAHDVCYATVVRAPAANTNVVPQNRFLTEGRHVFVPTRQDSAATIAMETRGARNSVIYCRF